MSLDPIVRQILEAVRDNRVLEATRGLARRRLERDDQELARARAAAEARAASRAARPKKKLGGATAFHAKVRRDEERASDYVKHETWMAVLARTQVDHRGRLACESCAHERPLEPHHLELGAGGRPDVPEFVMALCAKCHRTGQHAAHRRVAWFARNVVIPWARAHGFPLPNRKEYRA